MDHDPLENVPQDDEQDAGSAAGNRATLVDQWLVVGVAAILLSASAATPSVGEARAVARADALLAQMTREEKIAVAAGNAAGVPRLGIPPQVFGDGPNGVGHGAAGVIAFPNAEVVAATWDPNLAERFGDALGAETAGKGINVIAAPTVNIVRTPRFGRAAETFGEDPYLSGQISAAEIRGIQRQRVVAQVKHYAANNQEIARFGNPLGNPPLSPAVDVVVSERALQEIYFPAFKASVQQGGAASVMCSCPRINGTYACENSFLLGTLKDDWEFLGFVGPDAALAVRDTLAAANAGTDNFLLGGTGVPAEAALQQVTPERLDDSVRRYLTAMFSAGLFDHPNDGNPDAVVTTPEHRALAAEIAAAGSVLLKNERDVLPLGAAVRSIAVIGYDAGPNTQTMEGGSPAVVGGPVMSPLDGITARAGAGVQVTYAKGTLGVDRRRVLDRVVARRIQAASRLAAARSVVGCERRDDRTCGRRRSGVRQRRHFGGDGSYDALPAGRPGPAHRGRRRREPAHRRRCAHRRAGVHAVAEGSRRGDPGLYPGQETGRAIASVLFGDVPPSGRLMITFPRSEAQGPATQPEQFPGVDNVVRYDEGVFVGYRYYDEFAQEPLFPFGYGLSYTTFTLDRLSLRRGEAAQYEVSVRVTNTGKRPGAEVVQLYLGFPDSVEGPPNQLRGFAKASLDPGKSRIVKMTLDPSSFCTLEHGGGCLDRGARQLCAAGREVVADPRAGAGGGDPTEWTRLPAPAVLVAHWAAEPRLGHPHRTGLRAASSVARLSRALRRSPS